MKLSNGRVNETNAIFAFSSTTLIKTLEKQNQYSEREKDEKLDNKTLFRHTDSFTASK
jgi:hypothetical protein